MKNKCRAVFFLSCLLPLITHAESLKDAVAHAMVSNPEVSFNRAKSLSAKQAVRKAKGAYYPAVNFNAGVGEERTVSPTTIAIDGSSGRNLTRRESSIELKQNLFAGGSLEGEVERNRFLFQAQRFKTLGVANDLALEVVEKYLNVLLQKKLLRLANRNLSEHRYVMNMIKQRSTAGISRKAELDQAKARLALAKSNQISVEANLQEGKISYAKVVGSWPKSLVSPRAPRRGEFPARLVLAIQKGLDNHPTIKSAYADIKEAKAQYKVAKAADFPRVDIVLSASRNKDLDGLVGPNNDNLAMLRMSYNLFNGGADMARKKETAYQVQEAYEVRNRSIIEFKESLRLSWNAWSASSDRLAPLRQHVISSKRTRAAYKEQFKVGKRSLLDLLDSQNEYYQAQINYVTGKNDEKFSRFRILNGMGALFEYLNGRLPINVLNNDALNSHERTNHVLLNGDLEAIPYPDLSDSPFHMIVQENVVSPHPGAKLHHLKQTTRKPRLVVSKDWYVVAAEYDSIEKAKALVTRLRDLGMMVDYEQASKDTYEVLIGPYEYRGQAGYAMKVLKIKTKINGYLKVVKVEKADG
jgi:outer membrane protein, adhesin transport system